MLHLLFDSAGISRNEFFLMPIVVEFVAFVLIMIITWNIGYAIR